MKVENCFRVRLISLLLGTVLLCFGTAVAAESGPFEVRTETDVRAEMRDGVVPYWSSHLEGAESELIIPSGHWSHLHPDGMAEIRRILLKHLE